MNKKGFTLVELLGVIVVIAIISGLAVISINYITNTGKNGVYKSHETALKGAAQNYLLDNPNLVPEKPFYTYYANYGSIRLTYDELFSKHYIDELKDPNGGDCSYSYVDVIRKEESSINYNLEYRACVICKKDNKNTNNISSQCEDNLSFYIINRNSSVSDTENISVKYILSGITKDTENVVLNVYSAAGEIIKNETISGSSKTITLIGDQRAILSNLKKNSIIYVDIEYNCPDKIIDNGDGTETVVVPPVGYAQTSYRLDKTRIHDATITDNSCN